MYLFPLFIGFYTTNAVRFSCFEGFPLTLEAGKEAKTGGAERSLSSGDRGPLGPSRLCLGISRGGQSENTFAYKLEKCRSAGFPKRKGRAPVRSGNTRTASILSKRRKERHEGGLLLLRIIIFRLCPLPSLAMLYLCFCFSVSVFLSDVMS